MPLWTTFSPPPSPVQDTTSKQFRPTLDNCVSRILLTSTPFFAWAMADVCQARGSQEWRLITPFPLVNRFKGSPIHHCNLEPQPSNSWLAGRAFVCCHGHPCKPAMLSKVPQGIRKRHLSTPPSKSKRPLLRVNLVTKLRSTR